MTEQPVETEQQFLGNAPTPPPRIFQAAVLSVIGTEEEAEAEFLPLPKAAIHNYSPNAHRLPLAYLTSRDNTTVVALFNKSVAAAAKLIHASALAKQAEDALSEALALENLADIDSVEADRQLLEYVRKEAGQ